MSAIGSIIFIIIIYLPTGLFYSWQIAVIGELPETNSAQTKIPHVAMISAASPASSNNSGGKFGFSF
jgi:hypothetical protein